MHVFITGGTGFIGSLVVKELIEKGNQVTGLARSEESAQLLNDMGAEMLRGELTDLEVLKKGAIAADGVIHIGFSNDFSQYDQAVEMDLQAVRAIGSVLENTDKPFISTGGTLGISGLGRQGTEADRPPVAMPRGESENEVIDLANKGVRSAVVRLSPCVHDLDRHGLASILAQIAAEKGTSVYINEGNNVWPAIHRADAAHLFCLALESAPAGTRLNGVAEEGISMKEIAETIAKNLDIPVKSVTSEEAEDYLGWFALSAVADNPMTSIITKKLLQWNPTHSPLIQDINAFYQK
ncbi:SDR family oxidoreductase [Listeria ivanovii]|nr:SDR family oxidoreductase [Listeria ivanovii]MBK2003768.1 SDR family oxidoreductase [Listeria ivanovii subsp. londoniensis]MBM5609062.1 SDR family oxidoreductase [Listeria ivanovii]MBM5637236.1 SDR family oxidoreductase [Listeria ivanovii]MBM5706932.1 SDR family oxidoreductase [Listeria ivanovii]